jgi:hypothetical protein
MKTWLYQMNQEGPGWSPGLYRTTQREGRTETTFKVWTIRPSSERPESGDAVVFFFTPTGGEAADTGLYGWGVIMKARMTERSKSITFRLAGPSDRLKMYPLWDGPDGPVKKLIDAIRGGMKQGTMWLMDEAQALDIRRRIAGTG